eukprot:m.259672 g.259672  ORF g.259672 m.259672 type:complete len:260 (+) comp40426_c1_seq7:2737-3516(+)
MPCRRGSQEAVSSNGDIARFWGGIGERSRGSKQPTGVSKKKAGQNQCARCGYSHGSRRCPALGQMCLKCRGIGHFKAVCTSKEVQVVTSERDSGDSDKIVHVIGQEVSTEKAVATSSQESPEIDLAQGPKNQFTPQESHASDLAQGHKDQVTPQGSRTSDDKSEMTTGSKEEKGFFVGSIEGSEDKSWKASILTNGMSIAYKLDTGAQVNLLPYDVYCKLPERPKLKKPTSRLFAYGSTTPLEVAGQGIFKMEKLGFKP